MKIIYIKIGVTLWILFYLSMIMSIIVYPDMTCLVFHEVEQCRQKIILSDIILSTTEILGCFTLIYTFVVGLIYIWKMKNEDVQMKG